ncbi:MAG TPA: HD-GYP domain-containing protein [Thermotogota bacterium]|nr:HD-GYP domain-containing protein [Thermotogota bacterium]HRW92318.1 HD-GYP domain-containing protein [Thermotogota bacterium]
MKRVTLFRFFQKKIRRVLVLSFLVGFVLIVFLSHFFSLQLFRREEQFLVTSLGFFFESMGYAYENSQEVLLFELEHFLQDFHARNPAIPSKTAIETQMLHLRQTLSGKDLTPLRIQQVNYYYIEPSGVISITDFATDVGLDLSAYPDFWQTMEQLGPGDIRLNPLDNEISSGDMRLYAYLRLQDGGIFEIGISFENLKEWIFERLQRFSTTGFLEARLYTFDFDPLFQFDRLLSAQEKNWLRAQSQPGEVQILQEGVFRKKVVYSWYSSFGNLYFVGHFRVPFVEIIFWVEVALTIALVLIPWYLARRIGKSLWTALQPISRLSENMNAFATSRVASSSAPESRIVEVHQMWESFRWMEDEITQSFEELQAMNQELEATYQENQQLLSKMESLLQATIVFADEPDLDFFLSHVFERVFELVPEADYGLITLVEDNKVRFLNGVGHDLALLNSLGLHPKDYACKERIEIVERGKNPHSTVKQQQMDPSQVQKMATALKPFRLTLFIPVRSTRKTRGNLTLHIAQSNPRGFSEESLRFARFFERLMQMYLSIKEMSELENALQKDIILSTVKMMEYHDPYTKGHSEHVAKLSMKIAQEIGMDAPKVEEIYWAGIVHDMGKILVKSEILNKPSRLTNEEFEEIKRHPVYAFDVFQATKSMHHLAPIIRHHHERMDGEGYPDALAREQIPLESRILAVADAWDAMTRDRIYRKALPLSKAREELLAGKGKQFDPRIVDVFLEKVFPNLDKPTPQGHVPSEMF